MLAFSRLRRSTETLPGVDPLLYEDRNPGVDMDLEAFRNKLHVPAASARCRDSLVTTGGPKLDMLSALHTLLIVLALLLEALRHDDEKP